VPPGPAAHVATANLGISPLFYSSPLAGAHGHASSLHARAPWVLLPSLIILRCIEADNVIVLWCCRCLVWLFEPARFGAPSIQCDGMLYDDDDEERRGAGAKGLHTSPVNCELQFRREQTVPPALSFAGVQHADGARTTGPAGPGGWTRRLRGARAGAPGFHGGAAVKHARRPSAFRLDMAALLRARAAALINPPVPKFRVQIHRPQFRAAAGAVAISQSCSRGCGNRRNTGCRPTLIRPIQALIRMKLVQKMQELKENV
jgi:hypothetical protein